jgi:hypothetical protein
VCDQFTGKVIWAAKGRSKEVVAAFFAALGPERAARLRFVSADGAEWIRSVVAEAAPEAIVTLDPFHLVQWRMTPSMKSVGPSGTPYVRTERPRQGGQGVQGAALAAAAHWENLRATRRG